MYKGGIPDGGANLYPKHDSDTDTVNPNAGPSEIGFSKVGLGSTDSSGGTGKNVNPPAEGEIQIASRADVTGKNFPS